MYIYLEEKRKTQSEGENCARQWDTDMGESNFERQDNEITRGREDRRFCSHINDDQAVNRKV